MIKEIQRVQSAVRSHLPEKELFITMISFALPIKELMHLEHFSSFIQKNRNFIPLLPLSQFMAENDHIHWKPAAARMTLEHWAQQLNFPGETTQYLH